MCQSAINLERKLLGLSNLKFDGSRVSGTMTIDGLTTAGTGAPVSFDFVLSGADKSVSITSQSIVIPLSHVFGGTSADFNAITGQVL